MLDISIQVIVIYSFIVKHYGIQKYSINSEALISEFPTIISQYEGFHKKELWNISLFLQEGQDKQFLMERLQELNPDTKSKHKKDAPPAVMADIQEGKELYEEEKESPPNVPFDI